MRYSAKLKSTLLLGLSLVFTALLISCGEEETPITSSGPDIPQLSAPANAAEEVILLPTLSWATVEAEAGVKEYTVLLDTDSEPSTVFATQNTTTLSLTTALAFETTYYWKVQVTDQNDQIATSEVFSFTTLEEKIGMEAFEIPDVEFGKVLVEQGYAMLSDEKYMLDEVAAAGVSSLDLGGGNSARLTIEDIDGIQFFTSLRYLDIDYTNITDLDLSQNTNLDSLQYTNASDNSSNFLTKITLPADVSYIRIFRHNLGDFDATVYTDLKYLRLDGNDIANSAVAGVTNALSTLTVNETSNSQIVHLDMGGNLDADGNTITYQVSQALYNQLTDEGVNNKDGLVLPPTFSLASVSPEDESVDISVDSNIEITFSSEVNQSSISYSLTAASGSTAASTLTTDGAMATINPDANLANNIVFTLSVTAATGTNGASITETFTSSFTTISGDDILITSVTPQNEAKSVASDATISVVFSSAIDLSTVMYTLAEGTTAVASTPSADGSTLTITPDNNLAVSTIYTLTITAAESLSGGSLTESFNSTFTTASALQLQGVMSFQNEGTAADGRNRAIHLRANVDIADLSVYGIGIPNNGGGTDGKELSLPVISVTAGQDILFVREEDEAAMTAYFGDCFNGFDVTFTDAAAGGSINFNGDDAVELYENTTVIEVYGDVELDGTGESWEYDGSWGYRQPDGTYSTGAIDCTLDAASNASSSCPYPFCAE